MPVDIVVIARRVREGGTLASYQVQGSSVGSNGVPGDYVFSEADGSNIITGAVNVDVSDNGNLENAKKAAENVAKTLAELRDELEDNPDAVVHWNGESMKASVALDIINDTTWVITDKTSFGNGGVGFSDALLNRTELNFRYFDGDQTNAFSDFANPIYQNGEGLKAILLHEIAHLSDIGYGRFVDSVDYYSIEHGTSTGFYTETGPLSYAKHLEKFSNEFAYAAASVFLGENVQAANLTYGTGSMDPVDIYITKMQWAPPPHDLEGGILIA